MTPITPLALKNFWKSVKKSLQKLVKRGEECPSDAYNSKMFLKNRSENFSRIDLKISAEWVGKSQKMVKKERRLKILPLLPKIEEKLAKTPVYS